MKKLYLLLPFLLYLTGYSQTAIQKADSISQLKSQLYETYLKKRDSIEIKRNKLEFVRDDLEDLV